MENRTMPNLTRNDVLEEILRERVVTDTRNATPPRRHAWLTVAVGVLAFALGGTLVGGFVSGAAAAGISRKPVTIQDMGDLLQGGHVIGALHYFEGPGDVKIDLGARP